MRALTSVLLNRVPAKRAFPPCKRQATRGIPRIDAVELVPGQTLEEVVAQDRSPDGDLLAGGKKLVPALGPELKKDEGPVDELPTR
jgi:hypothetical protein